MTSQTLIHLVRHAEVENPNNIWYGRLEGWHLSERGLRQAEALGEYFKDRPIRAIYSSPLTRAIQTSEAIAKHHGLDVTVEQDILETVAHLQGRPGDKRLFKNPLNARYFINPYRPTWGEPYVSIRARMARGIERIRDAYPDGEVIVVSHMTPVLVARLMIEGNRKPPWRAKVACARASVTTIAYEDGAYKGTVYEPVGSSVT